MRAASLALARPRMVVPRARYSMRPADGVLVLQRGENPSTDYYLRPRLGSVGAPAEVTDLASDPSGSRLLSDRAKTSLMVVLCRYASAAWLEALEGAQDRLMRVAFFMDDDLPAVMRTPEVPLAARGKVALHFAAHADRLSALCSELWVSTKALADRYEAARPRVLGPLPEAEPPEPDADAPPLVVYHGTDVHERERRFVLEVARELAARAPGIVFEITGDDALARSAAGMANVQITPQRAWPEYLKAQSGRRTAISLAPLFPSAVNDARAPVKVFDAARLGAAGLYADAPAYRGFVRDGEDGLLLPMQSSAWASAVIELTQDPGRRLRLAVEARERLIGLARADPGFPNAPGE